MVAILQLRIIADPHVKSRARRAKPSDGNGRAGKLRGSNGYPGQSSNRAVTKVWSDGRSALRGSRSTTQSCDASAAGLVAST